MSATTVNVTNCVSAISKCKQQFQKKEIERQAEERFFWRKLRANVLGV